MVDHQPAAKVDDKTLETIIHREFSDYADDVKQKLQRVKNYRPESRNRIVAAIIKLANKNIEAVDNLIEIGNSDFRDVLAMAEYPRCFALGFVGFAKLEESEKKQIYFEDWNDYSNWLNKN